MALREQHWLTHAHMHKPTTFITPKTSSHSFTSTLLHSTVTQRHNQSICLYFFCYHLSICHTINIDKEEREGDKLCIQVEWFACLLPSSCSTLKLPMEGTVTPRIKVTTVWKDSHFVPPVVKTFS